MLHFASSENLLENRSQTSIDCNFGKYERDWETTASSSGDLAEKPVQVKISLCKEFQNEGSCSEGVLCSHAHSLQELLKQPQASCASLCSSYHGRLGCPLGRDCSFTHNEQSLQDIIR